MHLGLDITLGASARMGAGGVAKLNNPRVAMVGPSTARRNNFTATGTTRVIMTLTSGPLGWAHRFFPYFQHYQTRNAGDARGWSGDNFGVDSQPLADQYPIVDSIIARPDVYKVLYWVTGRGAADFDNTTTVASYCDPIKAKMLLAKAAGIEVWWENLWPRDSSVGTPWGIGEAARQTLIDVNAEMKTWLAANGMYQVDAYAQMIGATPAAALNPLATLVTQDGYHYNGAGARLVGKFALGPLITSRCAALTPYNEADAANIAKKITNTSGGTLLNSALGTVPNNFAAGHGSASNARVTTCSVDATNPNQIWFGMSIGTVGSPPTAGESCTIRVNPTPSPAFWSTSQSYIARVRVRAPSNGWSGITGMSFFIQDDAATPQGFRDGTPGSGAGGDVGVEGASGAGMYRLYQDASETFECWCGPFKPTSTGCEMRFTVHYLNVTGGGKVEIADFDIRPVADPVFIS